MKGHQTVTDPLGGVQPFRPRQVRGAVRRLHEGGAPTQESDLETRNPIPLLQRAGESTCLEPARKDPWSE